VFKPVVLFRKKIKMEPDNWKGELDDFPDVSILIENILER